MAMLCKKKTKQEINMRYSITNKSMDFVQISQNFMLVSIFCFHTSFKIPHCI